MSTNDPWPVAPEVAEQVLRESELVVRLRDGAGGGVTGASKLELHAPTENLELSVKWKPVPSNLDSWNNSPRKELAAYEMQKLFLDSCDYIVPPTVLRCLPLSAFEEAYPDASPNVADGKCVLGAMSVWLENVRPEKELYDPERFARDTRYACHLANLNLLTILIGHKDGRSSNFMVSTDETDRRVFSIDNGISFDPLIYNFFVPNWDTMRVGAVTARAIERVRALTDDDLDEFGVIAELRKGEDKLLYCTTPGANLDPASGARCSEWNVVQFGLSQDEIAGVRARRAALLDAVAAGEVAVL